MGFHVGIGGSLKVPVQGDFSPQSPLSTQGKNEVSNRRFRANSLFGGRLEHGHPRNSIPCFSSAFFAFSAVGSYVVRAVRILLRPAWPEQSRPKKALCLTAALAFAVLGQALLRRKGYPLDGPLFYGLAAVCFLWFVWKSAPGFPHREPGAAARSLRLLDARGKIFIPLAIASALLAYLTLGGNRFTRTGLTFWVLSVLLFLAGSVELPEDNSPEAWKRRLDPARMRLSWDWTLPALLLILTVGAFFRFYHLASIPAEMTSDHAEKLLDVWDVLHGKYPIYFTRNTGREAFQFYWTALLIRLVPLGISHLALKLGTSLVSWFTLPYMYLLGKELFDRETGLLAAGFLAVSRWHVAITRVGLRFPLTAFFLAPALYHLFRAMRTNERNQWLWAGFWLGAGLHGYTAFRMVPVLFVLLFLTKLLWDATGRFLGKRISQEHTALDPKTWYNGLLSGTLALLVFLPLLRYWHDDPKMFWYRSFSRVATKKMTLGEMWHVFWSNVWNALRMFNWRGDVVWVNTVSLSPVLGAVTGGLFILGGVYLLWMLILHGERRSAYVIVTFLVMLLPSILSLSFPIENPSVVRAGGDVLAVAMMVALPLSLAMKAWKRALGRMWGSWTAVILALTLWAIAIGGSYKWYFRVYDLQYRKSAWNSTEMAKVLGGFANSVSDYKHIYIKAWPYWVDTRTVGINLGNAHWNNVLMKIEEARAHVSDPKPKMYLLDIHDAKSLKYLEQLYPKGHHYVYHSRTPTRDFVVFWVTGR